MKRKEMYITNYKAINGIGAPVMQTTGQDQVFDPSGKPQAGDPKADGGGGLDPMKIAIYAAGAFLIYRLLFKR